MKLTGKQFKLILDALLDAFDSPDMHLMVRIELNEELDTIVSPGSLKEQSSELIRWAERHNRVKEIIDGACAQVPGNKRLRVLRDRSQAQGWFETSAMHNDFKDESKGDMLWHKSYDSKTLGELKKRRSQAGKCYFNALGSAKRHNANFLDIARLCRKLAQYYRVSESDTEQARMRLTEAEKIQLRLPLEEQATDRARIETAERLLETAQCDQFDSDFKSLHKTVEQLIQFCNDYLDQRSEQVWILQGEAYHLLGLSLHYRTDAQSAYAKSTQECFKIAEYYFRQVSDTSHLAPRASRCLYDVEINRALLKQIAGDYASAIALLQPLKERVTVERVMRVNLNLAENYRDMGALSMALKEARDSRKAAESFGDKYQQIRAREITLKVLLELLRTTQDSAEAQQYLVESEEIAHKGFFFIDSNDLHVLEASEAKLELNRVLAEIYLEADQVDKARQQFEIALCILESNSLMDESKFDLKITEARIVWAERDSRHSLDLLQEAWDYYKNKNYQVAKLIEIDLILAAVAEIEERWTDARKILDRAWGNAVGANRQRDEEEIEKRRDRVRRK